MAQDRHAADRFIEMMVAERGASANTVAAYQRDLDGLDEFLERRQVVLAQASTEDIRAYLAWLQRKGASARTAARRLSAMRQYYQFLYGEGERDDDPTATVEAPRAGRPLPKVLTEGETDALLAAARAVDDAEGLRRAALVELLYATGLRVSELVSLPSRALREDTPFAARAVASVWCPWVSRPRGPCVSGSAFRTNLRPGCSPRMVPRAISHARPWARC